MASARHQTPVFKALAANLKHLRIDREWTQQQLAEESDVSLRFIVEIERRTGNPTLEVLEKIAGAFETEVFELLRPRDPQGR